MSQRLFVGNLPQGVTSDDLKHEFNAYGTVSNVELKIKENLVDPDNPNVFAFVTLDINRQMINRCIDEFRQQEYRGRFLNVSVAKESFLDRLKREREEANLRNSNKSESTQKEVTTLTPTKKIETKKNEVSPKTKKDSSSSSESSDSESESSSESKKEKEKTKMTSVEKHKPVNGIAESKNGTKKDTSSSSGSSDSDSDSSSESAEKRKRVNGINEPSVLSHGEEDEIFIAKKRANNTLQNGRIKIESTTNEPIHVITKKPKGSEKDFDEKARISDLKRKESLNKMKNQYNQQKLAIQKALSSVDTNKSKKVVFNDDEEDNETSHLEQSNNKISLFDGDDDDDENFEKNFEIKNQYEGKSGEQLMKLQSKFKLDPRFQMNEKFLENDGEGKGEDDGLLPKNNQKSSKKDQSIPGDDGDGDDDERKWQLGIIEKVIGRKLETLSEPHKNKLRKTMLRYDPTKQEDQKFLRKVEKIAESIQNEDNKEDDSRKETVEVSKEQFYHVSEDLTKSFKEQSGGFSLLSLFRNNEETENSGNFVEKETSSSTTKPVLITKPKNLINNPFKFDSSDSESEDDVAPVAKTTTVEPMEVDRNKEGKSSAEGGKTTKTGIWHENFFIFQGDQRLKDGLAFFKPIRRDNDEEPEDYEEIRENLRQVIKKKIVKSKKIVNRSKKGKFRRK